MNDLESKVKRLEQKAESWKAAIKRIYPEKDAEAEYQKIKPFSEEAEGLLAELREKNSKCCGIVPANIDITCSDADNYFFRKNV